MGFDNLPSILLDLLGTAFRFDDPPPLPAPVLFPILFIYSFYIPVYLVLMGARSAMVDFKGWLFPRTAARLADSVNRIATLLLAGFVPGWIATIYLYMRHPEMPAEDALFYGYAVVVAFATLYNVLLVRTIPGLAQALAPGFWHAVPLGGFFFCIYIVIFLGSAEAAIYTLTFLFAPFGIAAILPFAASSWIAMRQETSGPACGLCIEKVDVAPVRCSKCDATYHAECWDYSEGCARKPCRITAGDPVALG